MLNETLSKIKPLNRTFEAAARKKIDFKTKPLGALGRMEDIAVKMSLIQNNLNPSIGNKTLTVFAGDHGIAKEGVSAFPPEVTPQMVLNFLSGGAAINVLCRHGKIDMFVADMGVDYDFKNVPGLLHYKVKPGTASFLKQDAMTQEEAIQALENGMKIWAETSEKSKPNLAAVGEMGIGNSTSASAIISSVTGISPKESAGRGTGIDDAKLNFKIEVIQKALSLRKPDSKNGLDILKKVGGFEIAGMAGYILGAVADGIPVVLDGIIATSGGLIACIIKPEVKDFLFSGHRSVEAGQKAALDFMGLNPIVDLGLRLGEGTGAAIAMHIIEASCKIMTEMSSFEEAGVTNKE